MEDDDYDTSFSEEEIILPAGETWEVVSLQDEDIYNGDESREDEPAERQCCTSPYKVEDHSPVSPADPKPFSMSDRRVALASRKGPTDSTSPSSEGSSAESRMARYKEERRRQLASQFGAREAETPPQRRYITRNGSVAATSTAAASSSLPRVTEGGGPEQPPGSGVMRVRTTRTSRLRAAVTSTDAVPASTKDAARPRRAGLTTDAVGRRLATASTGTGSSDKEKSPLSSDASAATSPRREKDKSSKRKSNLNRSLVAEEVAVVDTNEDSAVRRRRRRLEPSGIGLLDLNRGLQPLSNHVELNSSRNAQKPKSNKGSPRSTPDTSVIASRKLPTLDSSRTMPEPTAVVHQTKTSGHPTSSPSRSSPRTSLDTGLPLWRSSGGSMVSEVSRRSPRSPLDRSEHALPSKRGAGSVISVHDDSVKVGRESLSGRTVKRNSPLSAAQDDCPKLILANANRSSNLENKIDEASQKVDILTAITKETVAHLDQLASSSPIVTVHSDKLCSSKSLETGSLPLNTANHTPGWKSDLSHRESLEISTSPVLEEMIESGNRSASLISHEIVHSSVTSSYVNGICSGSVRSNTASPVRQPSSILKKKSLEDTPVIHMTSTAQPVSILKRKTSQDEGISGAVGPPVTFSPSVKDQRSSNSRRQGILKKRASLDESEVLRRRSCSPDMSHVLGEGTSDFKPILKYQQRRSSMEELVRRTQSPDPQPQSILKRRTSREDELDDRTVSSPEPQGILKRKSNVSSSSSSNSTSPHVSIAASVMMTVAAMEGAEFASDNAEQVRPILKKKSSSEDNTTADSSSTETPKPILKKKSSIEVDDLEDRPKKPILKTSRKHSREDIRSNWEAGIGESSARCLKLRSRSAGASDSTSGSDCEVRPILKHGAEDLRSRERSASPRMRLSFCEDDEPVKKRSDSVISASSLLGSDSSRNSSPSREVCILRRSSRSSILPPTVSPRSSAVTTDNELNHLLTNRRLLDVELWNAESDTSIQSRPIVPTASLPDRGCAQRPMSVAERIMNMENFLEQETDQTPSTKPSAVTGAVPKRFNILRASRNKERFHTQPVTQEELQASARLQSLQTLPKVVIQKKPPANGTSESGSDQVDRCINSRYRSSSVEITARDVFTIHSVSNGILHQNEKPDLNYQSPPTSPTKSIARNLHMEEPTNTMDGLNEQEIAEDLALCKSNSVSAKASMFAQLEEKMKMAAEEANSRRTPKGSSRSISRYHGWNDDSLRTSRFATQPVTQDEFQEAINQNQQKLDGCTSMNIIVGQGDEQTEGKDEDDPSKLSLAERVKFFNQKILEERLPKTIEAVPPPVLRKRLSSRFKTQPVTTEEMETAVQKISPLAASFIKPADPEALGNMSARAAKDKMFEHGAELLAKSSSVSRLTRVNSKNSQSPRPITDKLMTAESETRPKGILKHKRDSDTWRAPLLDSEKDTETESENEVKGILKPGATGNGTQTPELESFRHLKSVLKKETSIDESHSESSEVVSATNEHLRSILKPESTEWTAGDTSTEGGSSSSESSDIEQNPSHNARVSTGVRSSLRGGSGIDLVSILHGVEARARKQRQALISSPNNKHKTPDDEKLKNLKNLSQEKENKEMADCHRTNGDENYVTGVKKSVDSHETQLFHGKIVEHKSLVNQRKIEARQVVNELNQMKKTVISKVENNDDKDASYQRRVRRQLEELQHLSSTETTTPPTSDGDTSSSGGREVRRIIRNEAIARRRQAAINKQQREWAQQTGQPPPLHLAKSQSHSSVPTCDSSPSDVRPVSGGIRRSSTQPMNQLVDADSMSGASIADRLAALKKSGNTDWRKRLSRLNPEDDISLITTNNHLNEIHSRPQQQTPPKLQEEDGADNGQSHGSILADRLDKLGAATHGWKKRVGPTDALKFSVAGRMLLEQKTDVTLMTLSDVSLPTSQLPAQLKPGSSEKQKRTPRPARFRSKTANLKDVSSTPTSPQKESPISFKRSISAPGGDEENGLTADRDDLMGPKVAVPRIDDETFTQFYCSVTMDKLQNERLVIQDEDLDKIVSDSRQLLVQKRTLKIQRRNASRNPIKALAARTDLQEEYVEVKTGLAEKELKRLKVEKLAKHSSLAVEALAGLASKEDFTAVALKKASPSVTSMLPYKELMLLHIKGRRHVQTRLVEPVASSINEGDNYVLVTPTEVFNWVGRYSNVIERSRGAEVAQHIQQRKDLGCSGANQVITVCQEKVSCSNTHVERFWRLLGAGPETGIASAPVKAGHPDEDELYETSVIATNMVFEVQGKELVPIEDCWGNIPRINILDPAKILVFDFGSELYVWNGKNASIEARRSAQRLARELWEEGYDYSECDVCPLNITASLGGRKTSEPLPLEGSARPSWALLAKVNQHMETILFREKFLDWPDFSRVIRTKSMEESERQVDASIDVKPCDVKLMLEPNLSEPDLELEGSHLGRGLNYFDQETHRHSEVTTLGVSVWHILEYEYSLLPEASVGQFHAGDSYVVRWQYSITVTGRELGSGQPSRHCMVGRDRCAYFCWQGQDASLNEQGAAALLTVELDHERGPQVRVVQGAEPPAFLNLFGGCMMVHSDRRELEEDELKQIRSRGPWRLYLCRGEVEGEAVLVQVACSMRQLRSRACLVLLNTNTGEIHVWHGSKTTKHIRQVALKAVEHLKKKRPAEVGFKSGVDILITEEHEGSERKEFFQGLGGDSRQLYMSLANRPGSLDYTPRLFQLSSLSGTFSASEVLGPYRMPGKTMAFPFLQADLYFVGQPALFLLDNHDELWLWQGWWPENGEDPNSDNSNQTGSGAVRWQAERRAAMQTALDYWHALHPGEKSSSLPVYLVWAGLEPLHFTNLFPIWTDRDDIAELNIKDGKKPGEVLTVEAELARLTRSTYPPAQLLQRPLPDGVDPTRLELYLDPHHFQELLGMSKEEFAELPIWKQTNIKKEVGLF